MLYDLHLSAENYIEAGFALFLHAVRLRVGRNKVLSLYWKTYTNNLCMAVNLYSGSTKLF